MNIRLLGLLGAVVAVVLILQSLPVDQYVQAMKDQQTVHVFAPPAKTSLRQQVEQEARKQYISPIDARLDPVWKVVPGYNGRAVDVEKTITNTLRHHSKQILWMYKEVPPTISADSFGAQPIFRGNEQKKAVAIMINVAWGEEYLPEILKVLASEQVKTTFFLDGTWLSQHPEEARAILRAGHEIGSHGYTHQMMSQVSNDRIVSEIQRTNDLITKTLHIHNKLFAPPSGDFDQRVVNVATQYKMRTILWTLDTIDWRKTTAPERMIQKVERKVGPGTLILTHPTDRTLKALPVMIRTIKQKGLKVTTVSEVISSARLDVVK